VIGQGFLGVGVGPAHDNGKKRVRTPTCCRSNRVDTPLGVLIGAAYCWRGRSGRRVILVTPAPPQPTPRARGGGS